MGGASDSNGKACAATSRWDHVAHPIEGWEGNPAHEGMILNCDDNVAYIIVRFEKHRHNKKQ